MLVCRTDVYQTSWVAEGAAGYAASSTVPQVVKDAYAKKVDPAVDDSTYDDLKKMCGGMLCDADKRWPLNTVMVRERCACLRLSVPVQP